ncbi:MAG: ABC transporter ATP-binding protein [Pseudomonadota bacterium]
MTSASQSSFSALRRLLRYATPFRGRIWFASFCSVMNKLFDVMPEILIGIAIDVVVRQQDSFVAAMGVTTPRDQMLLLAGLTLLIWIGESVFEYLLLVGWRNLAQDLQHSLRMDTYTHTQQLDLSWFERTRAGNVVAILNDDINQLERFLDTGANSLIQVATTLVSVGGVFFLVSPSIALIAFTPIPVIVIGAFYFQRRAQPLYAGVRERVGQLSSRLSANISAIMTIKSFATEELEVERMDRASRDYVKANRQAIAVSSAFIPVIRMAILAGFVATFLFGGYKVLDGTLNVGAYGVLVFLTQRLLWPLTDLANTVDLYERAMASTRRVLDLLEVPIQIRDQKSATPLDNPRGDVVLHDVNFAYRKDVPVLRDINMQIHAGQTVALVGQTGSGKSTIIKLLLRFYQPQTGHIEIGGQRIEEATLASLRQQIGLVSQDVFLFHGSVRDNIAYGRLDATDEQIMAAIDAAEARDFIEQMPEGLDTLVGEQGQKLSGGQRQRLSIARALLKDPPILILDEATSAVDNETEAAIQRSLARLSRTRTSIVIAHRLSTVVGADQIHVIDKGAIVESGTHSELLSDDGVYANLWRVQTGMAAESE